MQNIHANNRNKTFMQNKNRGLDIPITERIQEGAKRPGEHEVSKIAKQRSLTTGKVITESIDDPLRKKE